MGKLLRKLRRTFHGGQVRQSNHPTRLIVEILEPRLLLSSGVELVSISSLGLQGNNDSFNSSISEDGRYVVFASDASNLVDYDTNGQWDIFVYDRELDLTERVSISSSGIQGNGSSWLPSISADGKYVAFSSNASNLVPNDTNGKKDIFVYDRTLNLTERVSVSSSGVQGNNSSLGSSISADGKYVAFSSTASNLVADDLNGVSDIFVYDRELDLTERVSISSSGIQGNGSSGVPSISADGKYVAFSSNASNLVPNDTNGKEDIFVYDRDLNIIERVSVSLSGQQGNDVSQGANISDDGQYVAFHSNASNLVSNDTNGWADVFVYDRTLNLTERVSVSSSGVQGNNSSLGPSISADGRYIAFYSYASNLINGDTNGQSDVFVFDRSLDVIEMVSVSTSGVQGNWRSTSPSISTDGRYVAFESHASNLIAGDVNGKQDIFIVRNSDDYGNSADEAYAIPMSTMMMPEFETSSDVDCFSFQAIAGQEYIFRASTAVSASILPTLKLRDTDGNTILLQNNNSAYEKQIQMSWTAARNGKYYLEASPLSVKPFEPAKYSLSITDGPADWTFMLYVAADNNLEPCIAMDIFEIMLGGVIGGYVEGGLSTRVNLIMQSDGGADGKYNNIIWNNASRRSTFTPITTNKVIGEMNMGNPATLSDFVNWSVTDYPAEHYALVMWDHGGQFLGACSDEDMNSKGDILDMADFSTVFDNIDTKLDIIGFNACLMAGVEPAYQMRNAGEIYIGSEPSEYGNTWEGSVWNYAKIFEYLFSNPSTSPASLAGVIVDSYKELFGSVTTDAISAIYLNVVDEIADGINALCGYLLNNAPRKSWEQVNTARQHALRVAPESEVVYGDLCDLGQFMGEILKTTTDSTLKSYVQEVLDKLQVSIMDEWHDSNLAGATGMTIYLPDLGSSIYTGYNQEIDFLRDTQWDEFVQVFVSGDYPENDSTPPSKPNQISMTNSSDTGISNHDGITKDSTPILYWPASNDGADGSGVAGYQWRVDGGLWSQTAVGLSVMVGPLADGNHVFYVRAEDNAGNIGLETSLEFVIDTISPSVVIAAPLGKLTDDFNYLDMTFDESIDLAALSIAGVEIAGPQGPVYSDSFQLLTDNSYRIHFSEQTAGGEYNIEIGSEVVDLAGNSMTETFSGTFIVPTKVTIGNNAAKKVSFYDDGSLVTVQIVSGEAIVLFDGTNLSQSSDKRGVTIHGENVEIANINISGNEKTKLTINSKNKSNQTVLGGITGDSLGALNARGIDLAGDITLSSSLGSMVVDDILAGVNVSTGKGSSKGFRLKAGDIGEAVGFDIAGDVKSFMADGDIKGDISASGAIKKIVSKYGDITGAVRAGTEIGMVGAINLDGAIISAGGNIKKVGLKGDITDTYILGGYDIGIDCAFGLQETGGGDTAGSGNVGSVMAKGKYVRSYTCAGALPYTSQTAEALGSGQSYAGVSGDIGNVKFGSIDYSNSTEYFGLFAATGIKPFRIGREQAESKGQFVMVVL